MRKANPERKRLAESIMARVRKILKDEPDAHAKAVGLQRITAKLGLAFQRARTQYEKAFGAGDQALESALRKKSEELGNAIRFVATTAKSLFLRPKRVGFESTPLHFAIANWENGTDVLCFDGKPSKTTSGKGRGFGRDWKRGKRY